MSNYWPQGLSAKGYTAEDRVAIKIQEHLRQLEERIKVLEEKK